MTAPALRKHPAPVPLTVAPKPRLSRRRQRIADATAEFRGSVAAARGAAQRGLTTAQQALDEAHAELVAREGCFADLLPPADRWGNASSAGGLAGPVGFGETCEPVHAALDDGSPHALICGPSGSGKTNMILAWLAALTSRYNPAELELYLLDFKEGVSFAQLGAEHGDPSWLPHARLVGVNINDDPEFGLALLQFLAEEMRRRAAAAKQHGVTKLEELRTADPGGHWPRIVAVIDEFQLLFQAGEVAKQAVVLLEDLARRGRSQGIHLVLASQDIGGIQIFWGRPGIFEQFVLRIGLPRATRVMDRLNDACTQLRKWHAVVNHESGVRHANQIARIPNAVEAGSFDAVQQRLHEMFNEGRMPPVLFDGSRAPHLDALISASPKDRGAVVGQAISVTGQPAVVALPDEPGRNLALLGGSKDAPTVLAAATVSLADRDPDAVFVVVPLAAESVELAEWTAARVGAETLTADGLPAVLDRVTAAIAERHGDATKPRPPLVLVLFGADAVESLLGRAGLEALRVILRRGPEVGVHTLGWWRSVQRLRNLLTMGASVDDIGSWVALDVHGGELGSLIPGTRTSSWYPRPGRGLWFDRSRHATPEVVFTPTLEAAVASDHRQPLTGPLGVDLSWADRGRGAQLTAQLPALEQAVHHAAAQVAAVETDLGGWWSDAQKLLWPELWMALGHHPAPDPTADPQRIQELLQDVSAAGTRLDRVVRRWWITWAVVDLWRSGARGVRQ